MNLKVLFWLKEFPKFSETFIRDQIAALTALGVEVHIFTYQKNGGQLKALEGLEHLQLFQQAQSPGTLLPASKWQRLQTILKTLKTTNNKEHKRCLKRSLNFFKYGRAALNGSLFFLTNLMLKNQIDLIHAHYGTMGEKAAVMKKIGLEVKLFCSFHGFDLRLGIQQSSRRPYSALFANADKIIAISEYSRKALLRMGLAEQKIFHLPNGIDTALFHCETKRPDVALLKILSIGRLVPEKDYKTAFDALEILSKLRPDLAWEYTIVGGGELAQQLKSYIADLSIAERVKFLGPQTTTEVKNLYCQADLFLLSSKVEVLPTVLLEAMASGLPCVSTDVGAVKELIIESDFICPKEDPEALAVSLDKAVFLKKYWPRIVKEQQQRIREQFDQKSIAKRLLKAYRE